MLIKKSCRDKRQISESGFVYSYPGTNQYLGIAVADFNGRVPDRGKMKNNICHEMYYVLSGSARVFINDMILNVHEGDAFQINPSEEVYVEAHNFKIVISTSPAFYPEQWENVE